MPESGVRLSTQCHREEKKPDRPPSGTAGKLWDVAVGACPPLSGSVRARAVGALAAISLTVGLGAAQEAGPRNCRRDPVPDLECNPFNRELIVRPQAWAPYGATTYAQTELYSPQ